MNIKKRIQLTTRSLEALVANGVSIDFRLDEPIWQDIEKGDLIEFWEDFSGWDVEPSDQSRRVVVEVVDIFRASAFSDLIDHLPTSFTGVRSKDQIISGLRQWWSPENEKDMGVLGWQVQVIND